MNGQLEEIYLEVLVEGHKIAIVKQEGNTFHIVTWFSPDPKNHPLAEMAQKFGVEEYDLRDQTSYIDFILQDE